MQNLLPSGQGGMQDLTLTDMMKVILLGGQQAMHNQFALEQCNIKTNENIVALAQSMGQLAQRLPAVEQRVDTLWDKTTQMGLLMQQQFAQYRAEIDSLRESHGLYPLVRSNQPLPNPLTLSLSPPPAVPSITYSTSSPRILESPQPDSSEANDVFEHLNPPSPFAELPSSVLIEDVSIPIPIEDPLPLTPPPPTPIPVPPPIESHVRVTRNSVVVRDEGMEQFEKLLAMLLRLGEDTLNGFTVGWPVRTNPLGDKTKFAVLLCTGAILTYFEPLSGGKASPVKFVCAFLHQLEERQKVEVDEKTSVWIMKNARRVASFWFTKKKKKNVVEMSPPSVGKESKKNAYLVHPDVLLVILQKHGDIFQGDLETLAVKFKPSWLKVKPSPKQLKDSLGKYTSSSPTPSLFPPLVNFECWGRQEIPKEFFCNDSFLAWKELHNHPLWGAMSAGGVFSSQDILLRWGLKHWKWRRTLAFCNETAKVHNVKTFVDLVSGCSIPIRKRKRKAVVVLREVIEVEKQPKKKAKRKVVKNKQKLGIGSRKRKGR